MKPVRGQWFMVSGQAALGGGSGSSWVGGRAEPSALTRGAGSERCGRFSASAEPSGGVRRAGRTGPGSSWWSKWALVLALVLCVPAPALAQGISGDQTATMPEEARGRASGYFSRVARLLEDWDVEAARSELDALGRIVPKDAETYQYYAGRVAFEEGRYDDAVQALTAAGIEDKENSYLRLARETRDIIQDHLTAESEHFIFDYPPGKDEILAPWALEALEAQRAALLEDLGYAPPGKIRVEVVANATELSKVSTLTRDQIRTTGTIAICKFNKLMVTSPKAVLTGYDWLDTLAHEYTHLVVSKKSRNSVPIWLHEGLAKFLESRWRGKAGLALSPSTQALLGRRVKENDLIPFEKMHPSIALLPTAEDAATAFAEVFYAIDFVYQRRGAAGLRTIIERLRDGKTDKASVEDATGLPFPAFEKAWLSHIKAQSFPKELLPLEEKVVLKENAPGKAAKEDEPKGREISFGEFAVVTETDARKFAHLGELMRERNRVKASAIELGKAHRIVGDKYEVVSNKYALALTELGRLDEAEKVLLGSLRVHPGVAATNVHLGRIYLARKDWKHAKAAYMEALSTDPFDPEVHLALTLVHERLGEKQLMERTRKASSVLTGLPADKVLAAAERLAPAAAEPTPRSSE
ncbi:MAG: hypothetical protein IRZ16_22630 [Myxococcaceae bacterium]|nr:hypothetical protein [Myxococcaceae bacterium]